MGRRVAPEAFFWILHMGIFVVWIPATLVAKERVGNFNRKDFWKVVLKDLPDWVRYLVYGFLVYAGVNFMYFFFQAWAGGGGNGEGPPAIVWRGFSGHGWSSILPRLWFYIQRQERMSVMRGA